MLLLSLLSLRWSPARAADLAPFAKVRPDPPPEQLIRNSHYITSNEDYQHRFRDALPQGGLYIGVGSEQNYLLAGWSRPEAMVLMDFDQVVVDLHRVYRALFLAAPDPASFLALWQAQREAEVEKLLTEAYPEPAVRKGVLRAYRISRYAVPARLAKLMRIQKEAGVRSVLEDPEQYTHLRGLFERDRVFMVRGDLCGTRTVRDVAEAAQAMKLPVRVLYLSNAERYFDYGPEFKESMLRLPMDERSVVLRTAARKLGAYVYIVQPGAGFQAWLRRPALLSVRQLNRIREQPEETGPAFIRRLPSGS